MARTSTEGHVDILVSQIAYIGTLTVGIIIALISLDIELTALFTSLGVAGFAVGFAMKDILGNFLSGIILLTQRPFTIGDRVVIGDVEGIVTNIRIRDTQITTYDGRLVYIPNNTLSTSNIINLTAFPERRTDIDIGISYGSDIAKASKICLDAVSDINGVVKEPAAEVLVTGFADSAIMLQVRVWVDQKNENYFNVRSEAYRALKEALDDAGIEIPFPVRTVYFHQSGNLEPELEEIVGNHPDTSG
jgi:small-conductance mechanosensitive channel